MSTATWHGLQAGEQTGNLEYLVDEPILARYRRLVGANACFPNLMAEDSRAMLGRLAPAETLTTVWMKLEFLRPPIPGRRVQVGGWLRDVREECDGHRLRASAFAVDEIGTEIMRSEAAFEASSKPLHSVGHASPPAGSPPRRTLACARAGDGGRVGGLTIASADDLAQYRADTNAMVGFELEPDGNGLTSVAAGWLEGLLGADFGEDFRWGGQLSIAFHRAVMPGEALLCDGVVIDHDTDPAGVETRRLVMTISNAENLRVATAEAIVKSPSPLRF